MFDSGSSRKWILAAGGVSSLLFFSIASYVSVINPSAVSEITNKDDIDTSNTENSKDYVTTKLDDQFEKIEDILKKNAAVAYQDSLSRYKGQKKQMASKYPGPDAAHPTRPLFDGGASQNAFHDNSNNGDILSTVPSMIASYGASKGGSTPNGLENSSRPGFYSDVDKIFKAALADENQLKRFFKYTGNEVSAGQRQFHYCTYESYSYPVVDTNGKTIMVTGTRAVPHTSTYQVYALDATIDAFNSAPFVEQCFWQDSIYEKVDPKASDKTDHLNKIMDSRYYSYTSKYVLSDGSYSETGVNPDNPNAKMQWSLAGFNIPISENFAILLNLIFGKNKMCFPRKIYSRNTQPDHVFVPAETQKDFDNTFSSQSTSITKPEKTATSSKDSSKAEKFEIIKQNPSKNEYSAEDKKYPMAPIMESQAISLEIYTVSDKIDYFTATMIGSIDAAKKCGAIVGGNENGSVDDDGCECSDIVNAARKEIGNGGQKYWKFIGMTDEWCAMFVSYCMNQIKANDNKIWPKNAASCDAVRSFYSSKGLYHTKSSGNKPKEGDIVLFNWSGNENGSLDHVGIVSENYDGHNELSTIEGNTDGPDKYHTKVAEHKNKAYSWQYAAGFCSPKYNTGVGDSFVMSGRSPSYYKMTDADIKIFAGMIYGEDSSGYKGQFWAASAVINRVDVLYRGHDGMGPLRDGWSQVYNTRGGSGCAAQATKSSIQATVDALNGKRGNHYTDFACDAPGYPLASNWIRSNPGKKHQWYPDKHGNMYCNYHAKNTYGSPMS